MLYNNPRILLAGLSGDSGKTLVSCGLVAALSDKKMKVAAFKKGPDYIDAAWLKAASGNSSRNLDTYLMQNDVVRASFIEFSSGSDISIIEGNRGLFDGFDSDGSHSSANLAKLLDCPVILIINVTKMTRTTAAIVLGCKLLDPNLNIAGVILNNVANKRQENLIKEAIFKSSGLNVVGTIPKLKNGDLLPSRYLGLVTPIETNTLSQSIAYAKEVANEYLELGKIIDIAKSATEIEFELQEKVSVDSKLKIGYFWDRAFSFYYSENLSELERLGAELVPISSLEDTNLPDVQALYIGGGFPEQYLKELSENKPLISQLKVKAEAGLPIYAECGGLMYMAKSIEMTGSKFEMTGLLPVHIKMDKKPKGHGYSDVVVDNSNPFFELGTILKGHEFHYSWISEIDEPVLSCFQVTRGSGCFDSRDGLFRNNVFACYLHLHSLGSPEWAKGMIKAANNYKSQYI